MGLARIVSAEEEPSAEEILPGFVFLTRRLFPWAH
jgi:hypothetical protein